MHRWGHFDSAAKFYFQFPALENQLYCLFSVIFMGRKTKDNFVLVLFFQVYQKSKYTCDTILQR